MTGFQSPGTGDIRVTARRKLAPEREGILQHLFIVINPELVPNLQSRTFNIVTVKQDK